MHFPWSRKQIGNSWAELFLVISFHLSEIRWIPEVPVGQHFSVHSKRHWGIRQLGPPMNFILYHFQFAKDDEGEQRSEDWPERSDGAGSNLISFHRQGSQKSVIRNGWDLWHMIQVTKFLSNSGLYGMMENDFYHLTMKQHFCVEDIHVNCINSEPKPCF